MRSEFSRSQNLGKCTRDFLLLEKIFFDLEIKISRDVFPGRLKFKHPTRFLFFCVQNDKILQKMKKLRKIEARN